MTTTAAHRTNTKINLMRHNSIKQVRDPSDPVSVVIVCSTYLHLSINTKARFFYKNACLLHSKSTTLEKDKNNNRNDLPYTNTIKYGW